MTVRLVPCIVVYTIILGRKNYIAGGTLRPDNSLMPVHHTDVAQAKPFARQTEVTKFMTRIVNHHNREYVTETAMIPVQNFKTVKLNSNDCRNPLGEKII